MSLIGFLYPTSWLNQDWMLIKLFFVGLLYLYHYKTHQIFKELQNDEFRHSSFFMRIWNEGATLELVSVSVGKADTSIDPTAVTLVQSPVVVIK